MKFLKNLFSKPRKILWILLLVNIVAFSLTRSMADKYASYSASGNEEGKVTYLERGWQIVNWSYNLLKYFKKPHTTDTYH